MKKILLILLLAIFLPKYLYAQDNMYEWIGFKLVNNADSWKTLSTTLEKIGRLNEDTGRWEWQEDSNGNDLRCACIRIKRENVPDDIFNDIQFEVSGSGAGLTCKYYNQKSDEWWLTVNPTKHFELSAYIKGYGYTKVLKRPVDEYQVYDVTLKCNFFETITIQVEPEDCSIFCNNKSGKGILQIDNINYGTYKVTIVDANNNKFFREIKVEKGGEKLYKIDVTPEKSVKFDIIGCKGYLRITNLKDKKTIECGHRTDAKRCESSYKLSLKQGLYNIEVYDVKNPENYEKKEYFKIDANTEVVELKPIPMMDIQVYAVYKGQRVKADLYVNNSSEKEEYSESYYANGTYNLMVPKNQGLRLYMSYLGQDGTQNITPSNLKNRTIEVVIKEQKIKRTSVWQRYEPEIMGFSLGYVGKQLVTTGEGYQYKEPGVWGEDDEGKWLSGVQVGFHFEPCFKFGLGIYTGLFYEFYYSSYDDSDYAWDSYLEHCGYFPIHGCWRIPFGDECGMFLHAGLGLNYIFSGKYSDSSDYYEDYTDFYGEDTWPKKFNMTLDYGVMLRIGWCMLGANFSSGITDHESYAYLGSYETVQNKMNFTLGFLISNY